MAIRTPALTAAFAILRFLARVPDRTGSLSEISRAVALNKSTCLNILRQLEQLQVVARADGRYYRLSTSLIALGQAAAGPAGLLDLVRPILWRLHHETRLTALAARRDGLHVVVVDSFEPATEVHVRVPVGVPFHLTTGALGKCVLAFMPAAEVRALLARVGVKRFTERSARSVRQYVAALAEVRRQGYATSLGEFAPDVHAVAAPVLDPTGTVALVMALAGFSSSLPPNRVRREALRLKAAAAAVMDTLGHVGEALGPEAPRLDFPSVRRPAAPLAGA